MFFSLPQGCLLCAEPTEAAGGPRPRSGLDLAQGDPSVRPQDDFFRHVNGRWLREAPIPADKARIGAFETLAEDIQQRLRALIEDAAGADADAGKIADLYASFMNEAAMERLGIAPLAAELAAIDALATPADVAAAMGRLIRIGVGMPVVAFVRPDARDATRYLPYLTQEGLGLPDRDYYLADDADLAAVREAYRAHLATLLRLAGDPDGAAEADAQAVFDLETALARAQWSRVDNRDALKTYHPFDTAGLAALAPGFDTAAFLAATGLAGRSAVVVVRQPDYLAAFGALLASTPRPTWRAYLRTRLLAAYAPLLSRAFVEARFAFAGTVLRGTPENLPRWKRGVALVEEALGEALGRRYVERHFPPAHKARMEELVAHLMAAYRERLATLDWMGEATRRAAEAKLAAMNLKIGHPSRWIDYSGLQIRGDDLVGNLMRAREFEHARGLAKLGRPVDRDEWFMTPQTVNAYYDPSLNEIVFPASILQPPFFDAEADDAVNFGAIGAVIGHEISHGFDDQGSRYDAQGNLRDWWTAEDRARFAAKAGVLVAQYGAYEPLPGHRVNGELSLGENIADNAGLAIAWRAWQLALGGAEPPTLDGLSGAQRFFHGWALVWRAKQRDAALLQQLKAGPHAPAECRTNGTVRNQPGFHAAYATAPGDALYLAPEARATIW